MAKTKIVGYMIIAVAILKTVIDGLDGGGFNLMSHFDEIVAALSGAGFVFLRDAIAKVR